jgi:hypothetical protein
MPRAFVRRLGKRGSKIAGGIVSRNAARMPFGNVFLIRLSGETLNFGFRTQSGRSEGQVSANQRATATETFRHSSAKVDIFACLAILSASSTSIAR